MKKYFCIIIGCVFTSQIFSQQPNVIISYDNIPVPIYHNAIDNAVDFTIMQDTINELFFSVKIIENSPLRFKASIQSAIRSSKGPEIVGWIDKAQCGVFKRWYYNEKNEAYVKLYSEPNDSSSSIQIYETTENPVSQILTVIDCNQNNWIKVAFYYNNILYIGWIDRYCSNVYDSCS